MHEEQGLTNGEIGEKLGISGTAVSNQLRNNVDRLREVDWRSPLELQTEFGGAISQQTFHRWAKAGVVTAVRSRSRLRLKRQSVVEYILKMLDRPCAECGERPVGSIRESVTLCDVCWKPERYRADAPSYRARWVELGKRLRDG